MSGDPTPVPPPPPDLDPDSTAEGGFLFGDLGDIKGKREVLSRQELLAGLTALMRACEGCEQVTVIGVDALDRPDRKDGCNWSLALLLEPAGVAPEVYAFAYAYIIHTARASWNLADAPTSW